ncbi:MAG TPA: MMPL family transporter [Verrucomicrobiota bacterium]|nr:MMPL family transporter [Verrucomicrobiota bacterium]HNU51914.1 MMPL family transporter [Verrucomicrobiota bacterium]
MARTESITVRLLRRLAAAVHDHLRWFIYPQLLLVAAALFVTFDRLQFDMNRNNLVGAEKQYHRNFLRYKAEFPGQDDLVAMVESESIEKNRQFVERLGARLELETNLFTDVFYKGDLKMMGDKALLFVTNETLLVEMLSRLREARPVLETFSQVTNLNALFRQVNRQFRSAGHELDTHTEALIQSLPALTRITDLATEAILRPGTPVSPGVTALFDGGDQAEESLYITFATNRIYLVTARARAENLNAAAVQRLRELVAKTQAEVPGLNTGVTGEPVLEMDEMAQSQRDTLLATGVSLFLCALLFVYGYQETGRPLKATLSLVVGLIYTLGFTSAVVGHLNLLTITFLPILVGLAIDFGIHLVTRYEEELRHGRSERMALERAMVNTGQGIFTGCCTTAGAFLAMGLTDFKGIREMGLISGGGLLICLVPMMTLLPALLLRGRQNVLDHRQPQLDLERRARIERLWLERPGWVTGITIGVTLLALSQFPRVHFDYNLLHMQSEGLPAVVTEQRLIQAASKSVIFGAVVADSLDQALELEQRLLTLPTVASVDSMVPFLTQDQSRKLALIRQIKKELADLEFAETDPEPVNLSDLRQTLQVSHAYFGMGASGAAKEGEEALSAELRALRQSIARLRQTMAAADPGVASEKLGYFQRALLQDLQGTLGVIKNQDARAPLTAEDLPAPLRHRFVGHSGTHYLLQVNPRSNVWDRVHQAAFIRDLRTIDPNVTGTPVQLYEYVTLLRDSYIEAAYYSLGAIGLMVLLHFRRLSCVVLALLPVALGSVWAVGAMGWGGVPFNPANIMTLPLVIGVGVTNGIHILNRFAEEQNPGILARSTGKAVLLSALTTAAGFGSLILAQHRGISSLGTVMSLGTAACMLAGLTFLPTLLNWLVRRGWRLARPGQHPPDPERNVPA